jgi:hypothetical protein
MIFTRGDALDLGLVLSWRGLPCSLLGSSLGLGSSLSLGSSLGLSSSLDLSSSLGLGSSSTRSSSGANFWSHFSSKVHGNTTPPHCVLATSSFLSMPSNPVNRRSQSTRRTPSPRRPPGTSGAVERLYQYVCVTCFVAVFISCFETCLCIFSQILSMSSPHVTPTAGLPARTVIIHEK